MAETAEKLPTVRQHADAMIDKLIAERPPTVDLESARQAAAVPTFSSGTAAIGKDGKPIVPAKQATLPEFTEGSVAVPEGTETQGSAPAGHSKEELLAAHQARLDAKVPEPPPAESKAAQAEGAATAEAAAEQIADAWAEMDEFEWEDPDLSTEDAPVKIPIRVPKKFADVVKRGYGRRGALDRALSYAKNADPVLRSLIENGQINQILPLLQRALSDPAYGEYVYQGYERAQRGLPLIEQAKIEAAQAAPAVDFAALEAEDPFFAERMRPIMTELETVKQRLAREDDQRAEQAVLQQQQAQQNAMRDRQYREAHQDLAQAFPNLFRLDLGPNDPNFRKAIDQAKEANYMARGYDLKASIFFGGQLVSQIEAERLAATGSPTADALREAELQHGELARREARAAARTVGGGSATPAPRPEPLPPPSPRRADGTLKKPDEYLRDQQAYMASVR
jgi:hypothetical protein